MAGPEKFDKQIKKTLDWAESQIKQGPVLPDDQPKPVTPEVMDLDDIPIPGDSVPPVFTNKVGRPTKYFPEYNEQAKVLSSRGFTDLDLSDFFKVSEATIHNWKHDHPGFLESIKEGKDLIDTMVERSLLQRAMGYSHKEEKVFCSEGQVITHQTVKHYPPDTNAASLWLRNRQPKKWRDKQDIEFTTPFTINMDEKDVNTL